MENGIFISEENEMLYHKAIFLSAFSWLPPKHFIKIFHILIHTAIVHILWLAWIESVEQKIKYKSIQVKKQVFLNYTMCTFFQYIFFDKRKPRFQLKLASIGWIGVGDGVGCVLDLNDVHVIILSWWYWRWWFNHYPINPLNSSNKIKNHPHIDTELPKRHVKVHSIRIVENKNELISLPLYLLDFNTAIFIHDS